MTIVLDEMIKFEKFRNYVSDRVNRIYYGMGFTTDRNNDSINQVFNDYKFFDIQEKDIVLDIGANIGAFSMFVSKYVKHVYAVEPITIDILKANIALNQTIQNPPMNIINNITVLDICLGKNREEKVEWLNKVRVMNGKSLSEIIEMCGGHVDFIKIDCEGCEWNIKPDELKGVRRFEGEIHAVNDKNPKDFLKILDEARFTYKYEMDGNNVNMHIHATRK